MSSNTHTHTPSFTAIDIFALFHKESRLEKARKQVWGCATLKLTPGGTVHSERVWKKEISFENNFTIIELDVKFGLVQEQSRLRKHCTMKFTFRSHCPVSASFVLSGTWSSYVPQKLPSGIPFFSYSSVISLSSF